MRRDLSHTAEDCPSGRSTTGALPDNQLFLLDLDNGFLFCPNHDQLFDQGWITFDDSGKICLAKELCQKDRDSMHVDENMQITLWEGNKAYLAYHREKIFKG